MLFQLFSAATYIESPGRDHIPGDDQPGQIEEQERKSGKITGANLFAVYPPLVFTCVKSSFYLFAPTPAKGGNNYLHPCCLAVLVRGKFSRIFAQNVHTVIFVKKCRWEATPFFPSAFLSNQTKTAREQFECLAKFLLVHQMPPPSPLISAGVEKYG